MITHNYCYNFGFFRDFFAANPGIKKYDVMHEMGMSDYATIKRWFSGESMMPLHQLMKFCNLYSVPITAVFLDENADGNGTVPPVHSVADTEPQGGWKELKRGAGVKIGPSRTDVHYCSNLPSYCKTDEELRGMVHAECSHHAAPRQRAATPHPEVQSEVSPTPSPSTPKDSGMSYEERMRYLDIIERQSKQIAQLAQSMANDKKQVINRYEHYGVVGEGDLEPSNDTGSRDGAL